MRKLALIVTATVAMLVVAGGNAPAFAGDETPITAPAATTEVKPQTICPIEGGEINKKLFADYQGKRVYFCCLSCPPEFKKDPAKYIEKMEKQGVTLDKTPVTSPR